METLKINMLGEFSISYSGKTINDSSSRSKKLWTLLEYLVAFRGREISQNELIELLWPEDDIENPANTLKTLIYRVRSVLEELNYIGGKEMLVYRRGACSWNNELEVTVDTEVFETFIKNATKTEGPKRLEYLNSALNVYKGDFLPKTSLEPWAVPLATYYHSQYLQAAHQAVNMLSADSLYNEIIAICQKATGIDPYDEDLHYWLILSLYKTGEQQQALQHYNYVTDMFFSRFGVNPSDKLTDLYKEIIAVTKSSQMDLSIIKEDLKEDYNPGAFYCEYAIFKDIYFLNMRTIARTGATIHICLLSLTDTRGSKPQQKQLNKTMPKLKEAIGNSLRRGDVFTRFSVSQFLIMLPSASYENSVMVLERISRTFKQQNPKSMLSLKSSLQPLTPDGINNLSQKIAK